MHQALSQALGDKEELLAFFNIITLLARWIRECKCCFSIALSIDCFWKQKSQFNWFSDGLKENYYNFSQVKRIPDIFFFCQRTAWHREVEIQFGGRERERLWEININCKSFRHWLCSVKTAKHGTLLHEWAERKSHILPHLWDMAC